MPTNSMRTQFDPFKKDRTATSVGQVSSEPLTWTVTASVGVTSISNVVVPAATGTGRTVGLKVPVSAIGGVHIDFGVLAATTDWLIEPGETLFLSTEQEISAIRAGASDVTLYIMVGVV